jgi:ribosomal protein S18 acetylase RimI-like enzyme
MNAMDAASGINQKAIETTQFTVSGCRFREIGAVADIQRKSFRPGLAYGYVQLLLLWLLPNVSFFVARTSGNIVAGCLIADRYLRNVRVVNIAVDPGFRRQGVGSLLLDHAQRELPDGHVTLIVEEFNEIAKSLYAKEGFHEVGHARNYYGRGRNGIWMRKDRATGSPGQKIYV